MEKTTSEEKDLYYTVSGQSNNDYTPVITPNNLCATFSGNTSENYIVHHQDEISDR